MRVRTAILGLCGVIAGFGAWSIIPNLLRGEEATKVIAAQILKEEFGRAGVREDVFVFQSAHKNGFDWIVTWQSEIDPSDHIGVSITPFSLDVWGSPVVPNCKEDRDRTVAAFGDICL